MDFDKDLIERFSDNSFILITGKLASGKSILAAKLLLALSKSGITQYKNIVSTEELRLIPHEKFELEKLFDYQGKIIHITESFGTYPGEDFELMQDNWVGFINNLDRAKSNNLLIMEIQSADFLRPDIRTLYDYQLTAMWVDSGIHVKYFDFKERLQDDFLFIPNPSRYYRYLPKIVRFVK